jgi:hypothetical protein
MNIAPPPPTVEATVLASNLLQTLLEVKLQPVTTALVPPYIRSPPPKTFVGPDRLPVIAALLAVNWVDVMVRLPPSAVSPPPNASVAAMPETLIELLRNREREMLLLEASTYAPPPYPVMPAISTLSPTSRDCRDVTGDSTYTPAPNAVVAARIEFLRACTLCMVRRVVA